MKKFLFENLKYPLTYYIGAQCGTLGSLPVYRFVLKAEKNVFGAVNAENIVYSLCSKLKNCAWHQICQLIIVNF
ncbi:hypothetical protein FACS1894190_08100 [Spirochaetia bacterium]|nr:hypothetical protein FACS1894190_08100 [Spirochaetia bacterium]